MTAPVIQFKRGLLANLPGLRAGEPGFTTDSYDLYIGLTSETSTNKFFGSHRYWTKGTASTGSGVNFVEGTSNGAQYITLKAPDSLSGITTFTLPGVDGTNGQVLTTNGSGTLSFSTLSSNLSIAGDSGTDTVTVGDDTLSFVGTAGEIETAVTNNQVQIGLPSNVTIGNNLYVAGVSTFVGAVTFQGGTITLGDAATDNIVFTADVNSNIVPNTDNAYDFGTGAQRWRNANFAGVVTATTFSGNASSADQVKTINVSDNNATYHITFVDANNGSATNETVYTDDGIYYNPGTNTFTTQHALFTGNVTVQGTLTGTATSTTNIPNLTGAITSNNTTTSLGSFSSSDLATALTDETGSGAAVFANTPTLVTPVLGTPTSGTLTNCTGLPVSTGISGLGANVATFLGTPSSSNLAAAVSDETGTGALVFANTPTLVTPVLGTPTSGTLTNCTGLPVSTGISGLGANVASFLATPSSANLAAALTDETGSGSAVFANSPTLVTPVLGAASATSIEVSGSVNVGTALSAPTVKTATVQHSNGTQAATIDTSGNITASQNLTVSGNLYVNGSTTQVNTSSMTVEDRTIELGQVDGSAPSSATTWDLGVLFNYNASGAKKSGVIWEHADGRFKFGSQVSDGGGTDNDSPQITVSNYAAIEIGGLWVNDCAGQSQVINCSGTTRTLENITIDAGTF